jgi:pimeloyl-ACP methyl ester carboxylesterase
MLCKTIKFTIAPIRALAAAFLFAAICLGTAPVRAEAVQIKLNGLTLNGKYVLADGRTPADGVALMFHGTLAHHAMETVKGLQDTLTARRISTLAVTLSLGLDDRRGMYDCAKPHTHRHTDAFPEMTAWLDWLAAKGVRDVTLMGHSRGGNLAAWHALEDPHKLVKRLALLAPSTWDESRAAKSFKKSHGRPLANVLAVARKLAAAGKGSQMMKGIGVLYCPGADVTAVSFLSYYEPDSRRDTPTLLPRIRLPILVVAAGQDTVVRGLPERIKPLADGKRLRLAVVEDADHFFLDLLAEDVADAIEALLAPAS